MKRQLEVRGKLFFLERDVDEVCSSQHHPNWTGCGAALKRRGD